MHKAFLSAIAMLIFFTSGAQEIPEENQLPVKLESVKRTLTFPSAEDLEQIRSNKKIEESEAYHDGRWLWYWSQHTDVHGNLVSPLKTFNEWNSYSHRTKGIKAKTTSNTSNWTFQGPTNTESGYMGIGRINVMAFHPTNVNTYWVGSAGGGAWKTTNNGVSWTPVADHLPVLTIADIDFNPLNPNTVYMCTGDRDSRDHYSIGILKSFDGGQTWDTTGLKWDVSQLRLTNCLIINPQDTNSLTVATSEGIYRSFNGGQSFTKVQNGNFKQVLYHPTDTNIVYATSFFTYTNNTDAQIFRSTDGGMSWTQVTNLVKSWRVELAVTPANPSIVKAVAASRDTNFRRGLLGVFNSTNAGASFQLIFDQGNCTKNILSNDMTGNGCTGQGNYDLAMVINPQNANEVFIGGVNTWRSTNGGSSWQIVNQWWSSLPGIATVHADKHYLGYHPLVPGKLFECNDGGIYTTNNPTSNLWTDLSNGLAITQFYRNAVAGVATYVLGGAQDNGTKMSDPTGWFTASGGDGMECQIDHTDSNYCYTSIQWGQVLYKFDLQGGFPTNITPTSFQQGSWVTPYLLHPHDPTQLIIAYHDIYLVNTWGGNTNLTNGNLSSRPILRLAMSPAGMNTLYAVPEDSNIIYYSHNFQSGVFSLLTAPYPERISDIKVDPKNKDHIYVSFSGYGTNKVAEYNPSLGWKALNQNLPNIPINCIEIDSSNGYLYIGTDVAVFYRNDTMQQWGLYNTNLPAVHVTDLGINYLTSDIWAATYGRGMWKSPKISGSLDVSEIPFATDFIQLYPNPASDAFTVKLQQNYSGSTIVCRLLDQSGRLAWQQQGKINAEGQIYVDGYQLAKGIYLLELTKDDQLVGRKKLVIR